MTVQKIDNFSNTNWINAFRFWLIKLIAGKTHVMINLRVDIVPKHPNPLVVVSGENLNEALFHNCCFPVQYDLMLHFTSNHKDIDQYENKL